MGIVGVRDGTQADGKIAGQFVSQQEKIHDATGVGLPPLKRFAVSGGIKLQDTVSRYVRSHSGIGPAPSGGSAPSGGKWLKFQAQKSIYPNI
jgi:hypothetical protein